ncbi:MAG: hypothetical protein TREMPRED_004322 [Tremellales sp. Tagirdzhanova-0007]|nr:MAG: hypothetical protein TREMPRED_004322 [Tremellales sp. Tagirdzhanova-0007]
MRPALAFVLSALLVPHCVLAFKNSSPFLLWSTTSGDSYRDRASEISSGVIAAEEVYGLMLTFGCEWETMVVVDIEELHQSHLSSLSLPSTLPADLHIPYLLRPSQQKLHVAIEEWAQVCGADVLDDFEKAEGGGKTVTRITAKRNDGLISTSADVFTSLSSRIPSPDLIILTGSSTFPSLTKRQEAPLPSNTSSIPSETGTSPINTTVPIGGPLLDRVQLLTTPIITALLITFGLFIPIIGFGVSALVGIQVPPRMMEISKSMTVGKDRKEQ